MGKFMTIADATSQVTWQLRVTRDLPAEYEPLLADGWEPFAVAPNDFGAQIWLRRCIFIEDQEVEHDESGTEAAGEGDDATTDDAEGGGEAQG